MKLDPIMDILTTGRIPTIRERWRYFHRLYRLANASQNLGVIGGAVSDCLWGIMIPSVYKEWLHLLDSGGDRLSFNGILGTKQRAELRQTIKKVCEEADHAD